MTGYWIHYTSVLDGGPPRFAIFEANDEGRERFVSPPGRVETADEAVRLLVAKGADRSVAAAQVEAAMKNGIAHLLVG